MRVKRFIGDNVADTMGKIKRDLGSEAVILQTRQFKEGGFLGFFTHTKVEITAAIEEKAVQNKAVGLGLQEPVVSIHTDKIKKAYEAYREKENEDAMQKTEGQSIHISSPEGFPITTQNEIKEMHSILKEINKQMTHVGKVQESQAETLPQPLIFWLDILLEKGMSKEQIDGLLQKLKNETPTEKWSDKQFVLEYLRKQVANLCVNTATIRPRRSKATVVALVGPTGVGKTTTIGKLAAGFSIIERRKVALITADTYRVAAVEQLKTFGEIIGVPVEVVMTPGGLKEAIRSHSDKELIFIDTAGRSPYHELHMSELESFLHQAKPDLTMLVMSVTTNLQDQLKVYDRFKALSTHLILTKLDECMSTGSVLDLLVKINLPLAYLTNGQNVPDDIDAATPERLSRCILGEDTQYA